MNLLSAVRIEGDGHPLQGPVATFRTEEFVHQGGCLEASIAPQYPRLGLL